LFVFPRQSELLSGRRERSLAQTCAEHAHFEQDALRRDTAFQFVTGRKCIVRNLEQNRLELLEQRDDSGLAELRGRLAVETVRS
jgi:hypothetical protein